MPETRGGEACDTCSSDPAKSGEAGRHFLHPNLCGEAKCESCGFGLAPVAVKSQTDKEHFTRGCVFLMWVWKCQRLPQSFGLIISAKGLDRILSL